MGQPLKSTFVLMAGLPGTGKTTLARELAASLRQAGRTAAILSKDEVRATLFPGALTDYTAEQDDLCFGFVLQAASWLARHGRAEFLFLDGRTFSRATQVEAAISAATEAGAAWRILHLSCDDDLALSRIAAGRAGHPAANRGAALYRKVKAGFDPIQRPSFKVDTGRPLAECVAASQACLLGGN